MPFVYAEPIIKGTKKGAIKPLSGFRLVDVYQFQYV